MDMELNGISAPPSREVIPAWSAASRQTTTKNHLCELPEELLLKIMGYLDPIGLYFIRQASALFARLFSDRLFEAFSHSGSNIKKAPSYMYWQRVQYYPRGVMGIREILPRAIQIRTPHFISKIAHVPDPLEEDAGRSRHYGSCQEPPDHFDCDFRFPPWCCPYGRCECWREVQELLQLGSLCEPCVSMRQRVDYETCAKEKLSEVYCGGCSKKHVQLWFSPTQLRKRRQENEDGPRCISWEGRVRLCPHCDFNWADIHGWISQTGDTEFLAGAWKDGDTLLECKKCFGKEISIQQQRPGVRFFQQRSPEYPDRLELTWRIPLSAVTSDANSSEIKEYDDILCPHLTFSDGPDCILGGIWQDGHKGYITCKTCGFRCYWRRKNPWSETHLRGRFVLWSGWGRRRQGEASRLWMLMETSSYESDESGRHILWCQTKGCSLANGDYRMKLHGDQKSAFRWSRPQKAFDVS